MLGACSINPKRNPLGVVNVTPILCPFGRFRAHPGYVKTRTCSPSAGSVQFGNLCCTSKPRLTGSVPLCTWARSNRSIAVAAATCLPWLPRASEFLGTNGHRIASSGLLKICIDATAQKLFQGGATCICHGQR